MKKIPSNSEIVHRIKLAAMKCRSNTCELGLDETTAEHLSPWLFGEKNILKAVEIIESNGNASVGEIMNLLIVANDLEPSIGAVSFLTYGDIPTVSEYLASLK